MKASTKKKTNQVTTSYKNSVKILLWNLKFSKYALWGFSENNTMPISLLPGIHLLVGIDFSLKENKAKSE